MITSLSNPKVKSAITLRESRGRRRSGLFLIDGRREIERALDGGIRLVSLFIDAERRTRRGNPEPLEELVLNGTTILPVSTTVFEKIAYGERNEGVVAVAEIPERSLETLVLSKVPLLGVIEGLEKPGNVGAIFRAADGAGIDALILADPNGDPFHPHAVRASSGTVFHLPCAVAGARNAIDWLTDRKVCIAAARCDGAVPYTEYDFSQPTAIVLGTEAEGLSDAWKGSGVQPISLPMRGIADSLNVATAAAILFYHAKLVREKYLEKSEKSESYT